MPDFIRSKTTPLFKISGTIWQLRPLQNTQAGLKESTSLKMLSSQNFWAEGTKLKVLFVKEVLTAKSLESASLLVSAALIIFLLLFLDYSRDNTVFCIVSSLLFISKDLLSERTLAHCTWKKISGIPVTRLQQMRIRHPKLLTHHEKLSSYHTEKQANFHICLI